MTFASSVEHGYSEMLPMTGGDTWALAGLGVFLVLTGLVGWVLSRSSR